VVGPQARRPLLSVVGRLLLLPARSRTTDNPGMHSRVQIVDYDPGWPQLFALLRTTVAEALGSVAVSIEHIGSTAVPGLAAKPIIDIDVVVARPGDVPEAIGRLQTVGYLHEGDSASRVGKRFDHPAASPGITCMWSLKGTIHI
jgi:GrpB-like predicted nucleotidyltransferase (UPF0157 family)